MESGARVRVLGGFIGFRGTGSGKAPSHTTQRFPDSMGQQRGTIGALIIRMGFWGPLYHNYNKEPQDSIGNYCPYIMVKSVKACFSSAFFGRFLVVVGSVIFCGSGRGLCYRVRGRAARMYSSRHGKTTRTDVP